MENLIKAVLDKYNTRRNKPALTSGLSIVCCHTTQKRVHSFSQRPKKPTQLTPENLLTPILYLFFSSTIS